LSLDASGETVSRFFATTAAAVAAALLTPTVSKKFRRESLAFFSVMETLLCTAIHIHEIMAKVPRKSL
jgi:hypothetical protein